MRLTTPLSTLLQRSATALPLPAASFRFMSTSAAASAGGEPEASSSRPCSRSPARIPGPVETSMQTKLIETFQPVLIRIQNDSSKHAHHRAMKAIGGGGGETHFAIHMVSASFSGKTPIARHRLVNGLLKEEFDNMGLHALSLRLKSPEEWKREEGGAEI